MISWSCLLLLSLLPGLLLTALAAPIEKRHADFFSVRTRLDKDHSGARGDPSDKYFHESTFDAHYDGRFADKLVSYGEKRIALSALIQSYLATMTDIGAETWLMHGTLLGWWWNARIMPWDSDIDMQVTEPTMHFLASYYNMTSYTYTAPMIPEGRAYLLEINPHYTLRTPQDKLNVIDARWIDTHTGLFIDITTVRHNETAEEEGIHGALMCKDKHHYLEKDLFPLRDSVFEGIPVKIPFDYAGVLIEEYGAKALTKQEYEHHEWNSSTHEWQPVKNLKGTGGGPASRKKPNPNNKPPSNTKPKAPNSFKQNIGNKKGG